MTGIKLYTSNRLEALAEALAGVLATPLRSPLAQEIIVVQSSGMERWLSLRLAEQHGICANYRFPFPNAFVYDLFRKMLPDLPERSPFEPEVMAFKIMELLPEYVTRPGFESVQSYLDGDAGGLKCYQLAQRTANLFDQYLLFRPEMILNWQQGQEEHWQAVLWRALAAGQEDRHRPALAKAFLRMMENASAAVGLPERVCVFGISALPRFHLQVLSGLAQVTEVNLFLMNPCRQYWGDIASERQITRALSTRAAPPEELYLQRGNALLASMGTLGRDFWDMINEFDCLEVDLFRPPSGHHLLSIIQSDILDLRDRDGTPAGRRLVSPDDDSIQIHSCHSPMRELEVLHDRLLDMFDRDPALMPRDILVMTPDLEAYAPLIEAVFSAPADEAARIPYSIADRSMRRESQVGETLLAVLNLHGSRFRTAEVLAVLESAAVQRKFELAAADLESISKWVLDAGIRWGIDRDNRRQLDLPAFAENTWKAGLDRLLLGYAMPRQGHQTFAAILPYDQIEGSDGLVLGRFVEFIETLFRQVASVGRARPLPDWSAALTELLESLFEADETTQNEFQAVRNTLATLSDLSELSGFTGKVDVTVITSWLTGQLEREGFGFGFIAGGVTFCAMLPMRSIPSKVICLVGLNNDAYPRQSKTPGFDLMAKQPRRGDPSRRNDDRYLFLETLLSARQKLYISYVGQSIQDNSSIPPSVLVSELLDYIERGFALPAGDRVGHLVTRHRLQAFSPEYFKNPGGKLFSYSGQNRRAAEQMAKTRQVPAAFISEGLSPPEQEWKALDLADLCAFFSNPARFLLNRRLGISLEQRAQTPEQSELFEVKQLDKYLLENELLRLKLDGHELDALFSAKRAEGLLPHGTPGECTYRGLARGVERFVQKSQPYLQGQIPEPVGIDLQIGGFHLTGAVSAIYADGLVHFRYARLKPTDHLRLWIHHLALGAARPDAARCSRLIGLPADRKGEWTSFEYAPADAAAKLLEELLDIYWRGLVRPVHFFPKSSWQYAVELLRKGRPPEEARQQALREWQGGDYADGEFADPYYELCFRYTDPLDDDFQLLAEQVFAPLLAHRTE